MINANASEPMPDEPTPAEDGEELLDEVLRTIKKYVVFSDDNAAVGVTLWTTATHAIKVFDHAPRLVINSPEKRCGKSRCLDIITALCHDPLVSVNSTVAAIYRSITDDPPTLIIDEADTIFGTKRAAENNEELRGLLNAGHQRGRPALRCTGPTQTPTAFNTFAMAALAGIGGMPDTITDRAVNITLNRRTPGEKVSSFRSRRDGPILAALQGRLSAWTSTKLDELAEAEPDMPVEDRAADTWEPLIAIADAAGGKWPSRARAACKALVHGAEEADQAESQSITLLADIKAIFDEGQQSFISSEDLCSALKQVNESPWAEFELNPRKLARRLRPFGARPDRDSTGKVRGYRLDMLRDAFERYLCQESSETSDTTAEPRRSPDGSKLSDTSIRHTESSAREETAAQGVDLTCLTHSDTLDAPGESHNGHGRDNQSIPRPHGETQVNTGAGASRTPDGWLSERMGNARGCGGIASFNRADDLPDDLSDLDENECAYVGAEQDYGSVNLADNVEQRRAEYASRAAMNEQASRTNG